MTNEISRRAADVFGGVAAVRDAILRAIHRARLERGLTDRQLAQSVGLEDAASVLRVMRDERPLTEDLALSLMAVLGLALEEVLPTPRMNEEERAYFLKWIEDQKTFVVAMCGGKHDVFVDENVRLHFLIRLYAMQALSLAT